MSLITPQLSIYLIDLKDCQETSISLETKNKIIKLVGLFSPITALLYRTFENDIRNLIRLIKENRFHIIDNEADLKCWKNANNNTWVYCEKNSKKKQLYIQHPKQSHKNILIEANSFYNYIEEEQKNELLSYIMSHCSAKVIKIQKKESIEAKGKIKANVKTVSAEGEINYQNARGDFYLYTNPRGCPKIKPMKEYLWLDKSIMNSINLLRTGAILTQEYEIDYSFGLSAGEAKTLGLDINKHKKYSYTVHIEC